MRHEPYRARKITKNTYVVDIGAVCYPYLLLGEDKALVIDTGMGKGNLREYLETITDLPMMVVNTHGHHRCSRRRHVRCHDPCAQL